MLARSRPASPRRPSPARRCSHGAGDRRGDRRGAARAPGVATASSWPGSARRLADSVKDLDIIATASDPPALLAAFAELDVDRERRLAGRERRAGAHAHGHDDRPARRRARPVRQPPAALHRLEGAQHGAARGGRAPRAARLRVRRARRRDRRDAPLRDRGGGLRAARAAVDPARAAREPRRAEAAPTASAGCSSSRPTCKGDLHMHTTPRDGRDTSRRWRVRARELRPRVHRDHRPLGHARLRQPRHARRAARADRGGRARSTTRIDGIRVLIGTETNIGTDGTPDYDDDLLAQLDWVDRLGPHVVRDRRPTR